MAPSTEFHLTLRDPKARRSTDVVVQADTESSVDDVVQSLQQFSPGPFYIYDRVLEGNMPIGQSGLRSGLVLGVGKAVLPRTHNGLELVVVGGPIAGTRVPFDKPVLTIGINPGADLKLPEKTASQTGIRLKRMRDGNVQIETVDIRNQVWVRGELVDRVATVSPYEVIRFGNTLLEIRPGARLDADVNIDEKGRVVFNRGSRILPVKLPPSVRLPHKPAKPHKASIPWIGILAPLILAVAGVLFFHSYFFLLAGSISVFVGIGSIINNRKDSTRKLKEETAEYKAGLEKAKVQIDKWAHSETLKGRFLRPDAVTVFYMATLPRRRLWERRPHDDDFLQLRVGSADRKAEDAIANDNSEEAEALIPTISDDPFGISLRQVGVIGVAGPIEQSSAAGRWLITQLATLHSPKNLKLVLLDGSESGNAERWAWMRWLPHTSGDTNSDGPFALLGTDQKSRDDLVKRLLRELSERKAAKESDEAVGAEYVVILEGARALRELPGIPRLLREGPSVGIYFIALDIEASRLPEEMNAEIKLSASRPGSGSIRITNAPVVEGAIIDSVDRRWAEDVARSLSPIIAAGVDEAGREIPNAVRLVELLNLDLDDVSIIRDRWLRGQRSTGAIVGVGEDGPFMLDLKEDGPHALVAGTTGSGKSELLQTLIVSLALNNRPDALNFLLIDYKGASAFADASELPHTVGLVTNLDGHLTQRALVALDAELKRREEVLKEMRASDVDAAWERDASAAAANRLARLVIVIDEFAELVQELPDFVTGLIRVARVGRSLGVHLVLATQRPAGVVSPEMRSNTNLRIALRMVAKDDSIEVIEKPDAALIPRTIPGRAYARLGAGNSLFAFQSARVAGRRPGVNIGLAPPTTSLVQWSDVGHPLKIAKRVETVNSEAKDLHALVSLLQRAATEAGIPPQPSPWLAPLANKFELQHTAASANSPFTYGLEDFPDQQAQRPAKFDLAHGGHLLVAGSARSGRTTAIQTLVASMADAWSANDAHFYALDFGNGELKTLLQLPHCGVVTNRTEASRVRRLLTRMITEVTNRQTLFATSGVRDINEQRATVEGPGRLPFIVLFIDRWEGLLTEFPIDVNTDVPDQVMRLLREGPGVGIRVVITGDRSLLSDRISSQIDDKLVMHLNDRDDFALGGINPRSVPDEMLPGRAIRAKGLTDVQFAILPRDVNENFEQALTRWAQVIDTSQTVKPFRVDALPNVITVAEANTLPAEPGYRPGELDVVVGVGGDELSNHVVDVLSDGPYFVVAGPPKSGRSTALVAAAQNLGARNVPVLTITPKSSPLRDLFGAHVLNDNGRGDFAQLREQLDPKAKGFAVVVDDVSMFAGSDMDMMLRQLVKSREIPIVVIVAGTADEVRSELSGILADARKTKIGLLLSPESPLDGDIVGLRLPRNLVGRTSPGQGLLCRHGDVAVVRVPLSN